MMNITSRQRRYIVGGIGAIVLILIGYTLLKPKQTKQQYQTAQAEKGTLITSVSASGSITNGNNLTIVTNATGTVSQVYVKNGDVVKQGQKIAEITLDQDAQQKQASAYAAYLSAANSVTSAEQNKLAADASMWQAKQSYLTAQNTQNNKNDNDYNSTTRQAYTDLEKGSIDAAVVQSEKSFQVAEQKYQQADASITAAKAQRASAWYTYQQYSPTITAPRAGVIANLMIAPGSVISVQSSSSNSGSSTPQQLGTITQPNDTVQASVDLSEVDAPKVQPGQKVTLTLDAFSDKTFTGKVLIVNTNGSVSSGVTNYPATIVFDTAAPNIYPNMAVTAKIITNMQNDVILVPSAAVSTVNNQTVVRVLRNNQEVNVPVEVGEVNDTQTAIMSGITEGETVITGVTSTTSSTKSSSSSTSPFSMNRGFGGGGAGVRIEGR